MQHDGYQSLKIRVDRGVAFVTIDHPPINLFDLVLMSDLDRAGRALEADEDVRVVVMQSADAEFFIAHADVELIEALPRDRTERPSEPNAFHALVERFRTMPKATIGKIAGIARGGGSELLLALDMRFAARGTARLAQPEVALGIIPGGGATQRLPRLVGRGRALEIVLGCADFDAETAERYGYVNRSVPDDELDAFVDTLAYRIAAFPAAAVALAKQAVAAAEAASADGFLEEHWCFNRTLGAAETRRRMRRFLDAGGQTREAELAIDELLDALNAGNESR
jgi:enoyl-CoA hydratase/carnithine racemase